MEAKNRAEIERGLDEVGGQGAGVKGGTQRRRAAKVASATNCWLLI